MSPRIRVLVADDHSVVAEALRQLLSAQPDIEVIGIARTGIEALERVRELGPDVVLMDVVMPQLDGVEATRRIRMLGLKSRVVILSMYSDAEHVQRALGAGALGYVLKRAAAREALAAIRAAYAGARYLDPELGATLAARPTSNTGQDPLERLSERENERALREAAENLRSLSRRLVSAQEEQRRALARELHDRVGQNLTALTINLEILRGAHGRVTPAEFERRICESAELTEATGKIIDDVTAELHPPMLDEYGLAAALRWYGEQQATRTGLRVEVRTPEGDGPAPSVERDLPLFRIAQEALNNVVKHAHASRVEIALIEGAQGLELSVRDDGRGVDAESEARIRERLGMRTMRERATAIGAHFQFGPAPGGGMIVRVRVAP